MKSPLTLVLVLLSTLSYADGYWWFEADWISDREATRTANPHMEGIPEENRNKFLDLFGHMRWNVKDGFITVIHDENLDEIRVMYFIRPHASEESLFEVMLSGTDDMNTSFTIWRIQTGFCMKLRTMTGVDPDGIWQYYSWEDNADEVWKECFKPHDL